jgi:hypothetical protein
MVSASTLEIREYDGADNLTATYVETAATSKDLSLRRLDVIVRLRCRVDMRCIVE